MDLADAHYLMDNLNQTRTLLDSVLESARTLSDRQNEAMALAHFGRLTGHINKDLETSRKYLQEALDINRELDDKPGLIFILRQMGNICLWSNELESGEKYLKKSLYLARELEDLESTHYALSSLATNAYGSGDLERSMSYYRESLEIANQSGNQYRAAVVKTNMGYLFAEMEDYEAAQSLAEEGWVVATEAYSQFALAEVQTLMGMIAVGTGQYKLARNYIDSSTRIYRERDDTFNLVWCLCVYAWLEGINRNVNTALNWLGLIVSQEAYSIGPIRRLVDKVLAETQANITDEEVKAVMAQGAEWRLEDVITEIIGEDS
jgi:tetratricopeptide (TPR) repeat protein